jgi:hypothetical protein
MNEVQARQEGLHFTGVYSSNKEEVKERISKERKECPKARIVLVNVPHNKLSRSGPGMGYSAYADNVWSAYRAIEDCTRQLASIPGSRQYYQNEYDMKMKELADKELSLNRALNEARDLLKSI